MTRFEQLVKNPSLLLEEEIVKFKQLLNNPPLLHAEASGKLTSWTLSDEVLHYIFHNIDQNSTTLETGAGVSTILFALKSSHHTCINPSQKQVDRIREYCYRNNISLERVNFQVDVSEKVLPSLNANPLDLILIDGSHAFPIPFIDWYYTYRQLRLGGKMIVDDTQLWTGLVLKQFLKLESEWEFKKNSPPRSAIFTKVKKYADAKWYGEQAYVVRKSHLLVFTAKVQRVLGLLLSKNFDELGKLISNKFG